MPCPEPFFSAPGKHEFQGRSYSVAWSLPQPRIAYLENLLTADECRQLREYALEEIPATHQPVSPDSGEESLGYTGDGMYADEARHPLCGDIRRRLAALMQWPSNRCEVLNIHRYSPGNGFHAHHDWFDEDQCAAGDYQTHEYGNRVASVILYLNEPEEGGSTSFELGLDVAPKQGAGLFFAYPGRDPRILHAGSTVARGEKWIANLWFRERNPRDGK